MTGSSFKIVSNSAVLTAAAGELRRRRVGGGQLLPQLPGKGVDVHGMGIAHLSVGKKGRRAKTNCLLC